MTHQLFIVGFYVLLPWVTALQTSTVNGKDHFFPDAPENNGNTIIRSFVSTNLQFCADAPARTAEAALALYKAMPRGELFKNVVVHNSNETCADRGYKFSGGEDPCYPGLTTAWKDEAGQIQYLETFKQTLDTWGEPYNLSSWDSNLRDACSCHEKSFARSQRVCPEVFESTASWVQRNPETKKELSCSSGPFLFAVRALAVLKSTMLLPMHETNQIEPVNCSELGFPYKHAKNDPCFTNLHLWTKTPDAETDALINESIHVEKKLKDGGFAHYAKPLGINSNIFDGIPGCHCAPSSEVRSLMTETCEHPGATSPIRDWWKE